MAALEFQMHELIPMNATMPSKKYMRSPDEIAKSYKWRSD